MHDNQLIDLKLSIIKPLAAKWFIKLSGYLKSKPDILKMDLKGAGITADYLFTDNLILAKMEMVLCIYI